MAETAEAEPTIELVAPEEPTEVPTITVPTEMPTSIMPTSILEEEATATATEEPEEVEELRGKECVQGYWTVDPASMQTYAQTTMHSAGKKDFHPFGFQRQHLNPDHL